MPSYLEKYSRIHFFSLDVEGAEWQVISTLDFGSSAKTKIDVFMIELDGLKENRERIRARLFEAGYIECLLLVVGSGVFVHRNATNTKPCAVPSIAVTGERAAIWGGRAHLPKPKPPCPPACPSDNISRRRDMLYPVDGICYGRTHRAVVGPVRRIYL